jgi:hypothetical protein
MQRFPEHPRVSEAMLDVAARYTHTVPNLGIQPDYQKAASWYERAAATATPGTDAWFQAMFCIAEIVQPAKSRELLDQIASQAEGDSLLLVRVVRRFQDSAIRLGEIEEAERLCHRIMDWYSDPTHEPETISQKGYIDSERRQAIPSMIRGLLSKSTDLTKKDRSQRLQSLTSRYGLFMIGNNSVYQLVDEAIAAIESWPEVGVLEPNSPDDRSSRRIWILIANVVVIVFIFTLLFRRWMSAKT